MIIMSKKIFLGSILIFLGTIFGYASGYFIRILTASNLSVEDYGIFYAVFSFFMILFVLRDFGTGDYLTKTISKLKGNFLHIKKNILSIISFQTLIGILIGIPVFLSADFLAENLFNSEAASVIIRIMSILFIVNIQSVFNILQGLGYYKHFSFFTSLRLIIVFILLLFIPITLENLSYVYVFALSIVPVIFLFYLIKRRKIFGKKIKIKELLDYDYLKPAVVFGAFAFISNLGFSFNSIGDSFIASIDTILIAYLLGPFETGIYQVASPVSKIILSFGIAVAGISYPIISSLWSKNKKQVSVIVNDIYKNILIFIIPVSVFMIMFSYDIINIFFGSKYLMAEIPMKILVSSMVFYVFMFIGVFVLNIIESSKTAAKFVAIAIIINFVLNIVLISSLGINGAAIATFISYVIGFLLISRKINKTLNININKTFYVTFSVFVLMFLINYYIESSLYIYTFILFNILYFIFLISSGLLKINQIYGLRKYF